MREREGRWPKARRQRRGRRSSCVPGSSMQLWAEGAKPRRNKPCYKCRGRTEISFINLFAIRTSKKSLARRGAGGASCSAPTSTGWCYVTLFYSPSFTCAAASLKLSRAFWCCWGSWQGFLQSYFTCAIRCCWGLLTGVPPVIFHLLSICH